MPWESRWPELQPFFPGAKPGSTHPTCQAAALQSFQEPLIKAHFILENTRNAVTQQGRPERYQPWCNPTGLADYCVMQWEAECIEVLSLFPIGSNSLEKYAFLVGGVRAN